MTSFLAWLLISILSQRTQSALDSDYYSYSYYEDEHDITLDIGDVSTELTRLWNDHNYWNNKETIDIYTNDKIFHVDKKCTQQICGCRSREFHGTRECHTRSNHNEGTSKYLFVHALLS